MDGDHPMKGRGERTSRLSSTDRSRIARVLVAAVPVMLAALLFARAFDRTMLTRYALVPLAPAAVAALPALDTWRRRLVMYVAVIALVVAAMAWFAKIEDASDFWLAVSRGLPRLLSTAWPSPPRPELLLHVGLLVLVAGIVTAELARPGRWRTLVLVPAVLLTLGALGLSAPSGPPPVWWFAAWIASVVAVLAIGSAQPSFLERWRRFSSDRRAVISITLILVASLAGLGAWDAAHRADPRNDRAGRRDEVFTVNALASVVAERALEPPRPLYRITDPPTDRWRILALDEYDGVRWTIREELSPIGRRLPEGSDDNIELRDVTITALDRPLDWIPVAGDVRTLDHDAVADSDRTIFRLDPVGDVNTSLQMTLALPQGEQALTGGEAFTAADQIEADSGDDEFQTELRDQALRMAGESEDLATQLASVAEVLRDEYSIDPDAAAGTNAGVIRSMLATQRGTEEQYVVAYALLAQALGADVRIGVGYVMQDGTDVIASSDARAWPEVRVEGGPWVVIDPVPINVAEQQADQVTALDGRAATPPPPAEPPPSTPSREAVPVTETVAGGSLIDGVVAIVLAAASVMSLLGLVAAAIIGTLVLMKRRRRRRRLEAASRSDQVVGAWAEATDAMVDHGAVFFPYQTNLDIAEASTSIAGDDAGEHLVVLATLANAAAHGPTEPDQLTVAHAIRLLGQVEEAVALRHTRWERLTATLGTRSLRTRTKSPVG
jgi:protein-glutamine gamma-glutamyltransferase